MQRRESTLRESRRKRVVKLEAFRRKRAEINDLINKEIRCRDGAQNLLNACKNREIQERLRLELIFMDSKVAYLKDQLAELNGDWSVFHKKYTRASELLENLCLNAQNDYSLTSSLLSVVEPSQSDPVNRFAYERTLTSDIMIYLPLKETINKLNFEIGFKQFIQLHFKEDPSNYIEQIKQFNYFRESTIRLSYEPDIDSIKRLFEYYNSLVFIEKRFFHQSQCNFIYFIWNDSINGIQSTQKSIQFEKASILFNCAALFTQIAGLRQNSAHNSIYLLSEQKLYWQSAAGCLKYLNANFSNAPSMDMSGKVLELFVEIFVCQAYEVEVKILLKHSDTIEFCNFLTIAKIYSHISDKYSETSTKISATASIKTFLPEIWFYLVKVKSLHFKALAHYYAGIAIATSDYNDHENDVEMMRTFESLHVMSNHKTKLKVLNKIETPYTIGNYENSYRQNQQSLLIELNQYYNYSILKSSPNKRAALAKAHFRESLVHEKEAIRQHGFCRKFTKNDYLYELLCFHHEIALEKFMEYDCNFDVELLEVLPIDPNLDDNYVLDPVDPNLQDYMSKDFFNLIGPLKIYCCDYDLSASYTCIVKKLPNQQTFGLTLKGDCPVKVSLVDPKSCAYNAGIKEGDFIIAIQDNDVRWSKHAQVVEKIRSCTSFVKLTLINAMPITECLQKNLTTSSSNSLYSVTKPIENRKTNGKKAHAQNKFTSSVSTMFTQSVGRSTQANKNSINKVFNSFRLPFRTITIGQKLKKNASKFNIFSSFKIKQKPEQSVKEVETKKKNNLLYKTI